MDGKEKGVETLHASLETPNPEEIPQQSPSQSYGDCIYRSLYSIKYGPRKDPEGSDKRDKEVEGRRTKGGQVAT